MLYCQNMQNNCSDEYWKFGTGIQKDIPYLVN